VRQLANIQKYPTLRVATTLVTEFKPPGPELEGGECDKSLHAAITDETTCTGFERAWGAFVLVVRRTIKINETNVNAVTRPPNHKTSP
jgi:hypothetical protein